MKSSFSNKTVIAVSIAAVIVIIIVTFVMLQLAATVKAVVFVEDTAAGTEITESMLKVIDVPKDTPGDFKKSKESIIGSKVVSNVKANQLIYDSDLMTSIDVYYTEESEDYIVTSITLPDEHALNGLISVGDIVDISVEPKNNNSYELAKALPEYNIDAALNGGLYFILSNVKIIDSSSAISTEQGSNLSSTTDSKNNNTSTSSAYVISLSYNDYKKLRVAEEFGDIYMTLAPAQNEEYAPLIDDMVAPITGGLSDSAGDPITEKAPEVKPSSTPEVK